MLNLVRIVTKGLVQNWHLVCVLWTASLLCKQYWASHFCTKSSYVVPNHIGSLFVPRHLSTMSEYRSKSMSRWKLMTNWGLDMISFECVLVLSVKPSSTQYKVSEHGVHCNFICSWIACEFSLHSAYCIIDKAISAGFSSLQRARHLLP